MHWCMFLLCCDIQSKGMECNENLQTGTPWLTEMGTNFITLIEVGGVESRHLLGDWLPFLAEAIKGPKNS